jgi:hypothetical protein
MFFSLIIWFYFGILFVFEATKIVESADNFTFFDVIFGLLILIPGFFYVKFVIKNIDKLDNKVVPVSNEDSGEKIFGDFWKSFKSIQYLILFAGIFSLLVIPFAEYMEGSINSLSDLMTILFRIALVPLLIVLVSAPWYLFSVKIDNDIIELIVLNNFVIKTIYCHEIVDVKWKHKSHNVILQLTNNRIQRLPLFQKSERYKLYKYLKSL